MENNTDILNTFFNLPFLTIYLLCILLLYLVFSLLLIRQVNLLSKVLITGVNKYFRFIAILNLILIIISIIIILLKL